MFGFLLAAVMIAGGAGVRFGLWAALIAGGVMLLVDVLIPDRWHEDGGTTKARRARKGGG